MNILQRIHQRFDTEFVTVGEQIKYVEVKNLVVAEQLKQFLDQAIIEVLIEVVPKILGEEEPMLKENRANEEFWMDENDYRKLRNKLRDEQLAKFKKLVEEITEGSLRVKK